MAHSLGPRHATARLGPGCATAALSATGGIEQECSGSGPLAQFLGTCQEKPYGITRICL
jgi:hypothetical protein